MRSLKLFIVAALVSVFSAPVAARAEPVVCHDYPGGCCEGVSIGGKEIVPIYC